jgi:hypothetical protein
VVPIEWRAAPNRRGTPGGSCRRLRKHPGCTGLQREFHGLMYDRLHEPGGLEKMTEFYIGLQPYGTPEQVFDKTKSFCDLVGADGYVGVFRYGGMPPEVAERSIRLFAAEVMPELKALPAAGIVSNTSGPELPSGFHAARTN